MEKRIEVWICSDPTCGNYYASSNAPDLRLRTTGDRGPNGEVYPERGHPRSQCPDCGSDRILVPVAFETPRGFPTAKVTPRPVA